jgi:hypothetical protein
MPPSAPDKTDPVCLRARFARDGSGSLSDDNGPNFPPEDGRGDSDSTPAC